MRVYLDVCCLNRPFDDQAQERIRVESEAVRSCVELFQHGVHHWVSSEVVEWEVSRMPDNDKRERVSSLLVFAREHVSVDASVAELARNYGAQGILAFDALHLAVAETHHCDILLTTDDAFIRRARKVAPTPMVRIENPARWIVETIQP